MEFPVKLALKVTVAKVPLPIFTGGAPNRVTVK